MPLYICNSRSGLLDDTAKHAIANAITDIHCEVTGAPPRFVHAVFFEEADAYPLGENTARVLGTIRKGRTEEQIASIAEQISAFVCTTAGLAGDDVATTIVETPASWVMEGGDVMPEPGEEEEWLAAHAAK